MTRKAVEEVRIRSHRSLSNPLCLHRYPNWGEKGNGRGRAVDVIGGVATASSAVPAERASTVQVIRPVPAPPVPRSGCA
ncbi:hypothetical protein BRAS3809_5310004 [Bradyrhizobium sp. STM 3809]|nr:hypothetical protein BRAS3809_5310004 [Bradyrhizobium sp. STM 3809]